MNTSWIVVGASPCADVALRKSLTRQPDSTRIACNAAIWLFKEERLDFYWLTDAEARVKHKQDCIDMRAKGTRLVTLDVGAEKLERRGLSDADVFVKPNPCIGPKRYYSFRKNIDCCFSGLWSLAFALDHRPDVVHVCGLEGYRGTLANHKDDYFTGEIGPKNGCDYTTVYIQPYMQSCLDECPDTHFVLYGKPAYEITGNNLEVVTC